MEKYKNEHGKLCFKGVTEITPFNSDLFHLVEPGYEDDMQFAFHSNQFFDCTIFTALHSPEGTYIRMCCSH